MIEGAKCRPGCKSSMPSLAENGDPGYSWWDLYNVSNYFHAQGHDVFILSMPLKGRGPGSGSFFSRAQPSLLGRLLHTLRARRSQGDGCGWVGWGRGHNSATSRPLSRY